MRNNELCLVSMDGQKFKAHKIIISVSSIVFKKLLLNDKNPHSLIFIRRIQIKSQFLHSFTLKKDILKHKKVEPFVK